MELRPVSPTAKAPAEAFTGDVYVNLMCHLAMLEGTGDGDGTTWLEPASDADYKNANQA
jgi:hypothetical protein